MIKYILKRLLQLIPILIGITFLSFAMMRLAGGDAVTYMYENAGSAVSQEVIDTVGVVSEACALQMASGARNLLKVVWTSRFLFSMRNGLQEWQPEIWARATYPNEMFMKHL